MVSSMPARPRTTSAGCTPAVGGHRRSGFTLVELLVVLLIVGMLAAILTPVVMQSLAKARNAAIKAEIDMLHMAIMNYKNEYGSFPPAATATYGSTPPSAAVRHLQRLFPRCSAPVNQFTAVGFSGETSWPSLLPNTALVLWLTGFTENPTSPLRPDVQRKKLYDFDQARVSSFQYAPSNKPSSPYIYIDNANYGLVFGVYMADPNVNPETFQILCAGRDEQWGTEDDLSNFWPGTRGEYLDSLNN
jgi:prepilin-type N-terminal cleavage/methylation domain-containing protein